MTKTRLYFHSEELRELHRIARARRQPVAELIREAVRAVWLRPEAAWPIGLWTGPLPHGRASADHDSVFDLED
jgi:hypothetical protein